MAQEFGNILARWFWLVGDVEVGGVSQGVVVKMLARAEVS